MSAEMPRLRERGNPKLAKKYAVLERRVRKVYEEARALHEENPAWGFLALEALQTAASRLGWSEFEVAHYRDQEHRDENSRWRHHKELALNGDPSAQQWIENHPVEP